MSFKNNLPVFLLGVSLLVLGVISSSLFSGKGESRDYFAMTDSCEVTETRTQARINCWYGVFRLAFIEEGIEKAFEVFAYSYENFKDFSDTGCHRHAHRMGDIAYYSEFINEKDLAKMDFPQNANACGYGFYHGFVEHLIQDNPEPTYAEKQCLYLIDRLKDTAPGIETVCYHASGHGFLLGQADELQRPEEWTIENFTTLPLDKCDSLKTTDPHLKHECRQGVFNVFVDWMETEEYGFKYNPYNPYTYCKTLENEDHKYDCFVEMTRKIEYASNLNPVEELAIIQTGDWPEIEDYLLTIAVAGVIMHDPYGSQKLITEQCRELPQEFQQTCFHAIVHGLFEHGIPDEEYKLADVYCHSDFLISEETNWCYDFMDVKLNRFRTESQLSQLCTDSLLSEETCTTLKK